MGLKKLRYRDRVDSNRPRKGEGELPASLASESRNDRSISRGGSPSRRTHGRDSASGGMFELRRSNRSRRLIWIFMAVTATALSISMFRWASGSSSFIERTTYLPPMQSTPFLLHLRGQVTPTPHRIEDLPRQTSIIKESDISLGIEDVFVAEGQTSLVIGLDEEVSPDNEERKIDRDRVTGDEDKTKKQQKDEASSSADYHYEAARKTEEAPPGFLTVGYEDDVLDTTHPARVTLNEAFSGSWWTSIPNFLRYDDKLFEKDAWWLEATTIDLFTANIDRVLMAKDWLAFGVEHMSKWWKLVEECDAEGTTERVIEVLSDYTKSQQLFVGGDEEDVSSPSADAPQETIVVVSYQPYANDELTKWSLAATLSSHISTGMGRIVVSGRLDEDESIVSEAFDIVTEQFGQHLTELKFCLSYNEPTGDDDIQYNQQKLSLKKLRHVLLGKANRDDILCWLGETAIDNERRAKNESHDSWQQSRWKYISLTEPDILLTARPSSLGLLSEKLKEGYVLAPHRFQPLPHGSDFKGLEVASDKSCVIPADGPFEHVREVNSNDMSCCDAGRYMPKENLGPYNGQLQDFWDGTLWWQYGFDRTSEMSVQDAHKHLLPYHLFRLVDGTGVVTVGSAHGKMCYPQQGVNMC